MILYESFLIARTWQENEGNKQFDSLGKCELDMPSQISNL